MRITSRLWRAANGFMAAIFFFALAVQYNDPDPIQWMAIYGAAAGSCILSIAGKLKWYMPTIVGAVALIWAALLVPGVMWGPEPVGMFASMQMPNLAVEEAREMLGLSIVVVWMLALSLASRKKAG